MLIHPMPDPVAFSLGPLAVRWYGLMYLLAFAQFIALGRLRVSASPTSPRPAGRRKIWTTCCSMACWAW